jgi:(E)-4-hydroxy-3-methylbut-2-enyl-diphosphate synthase
VDVYGPSEADIGVSSGNGKGRIFVKGRVVNSIPEHRIVDTLLNTSWS